VQISPVTSSPLSSVGSLTAFLPTAPNDNVKASFGSFLGQAVDNLSSLENHADAASAALASGQKVDIHNVVMANEEAGIAFQLAMTVRSKAVEAYQDIMRMQV
jgi:flagellar hook-basal body complex protein FliE